MLWPVLCGVSWFGGGGEGKCSEILRIPRFIPNCSRALLKLIVDLRLCCECMRSWVIFCLFFCGFFFQIEDEATKFGRPLGIRTVSVIGGVSKSPLLVHFRVGICSEI